MFYLSNAVAFHSPFSKYLTVVCNDLELKLFKVIHGQSSFVPIESPLVVDYLTSNVSNIASTSSETIIVSVTVFQILDM